MLANNSSTHKCNDSYEHKTFVQPIVHGVNVWLQLNDSHRLSNLIEDIHQEANRATGRTAKANHPHAMSRFRPSWGDADEFQQAGLFATPVEYGRMTPSGEWQQFDAYVCNTYNEVQVGSAGIANNSRKVRVEIHKRLDELVYEDGNEYPWPCGWDTGKQHTGTAIKIQASYVSSIPEAIAHAAELIGATVGDMNRVRTLMKTVIYETVRFEGLEVHHRHHQDSQDATVETIRDSARLVAHNGGSGKEKGAVERGHYQIWGFKTDNFDSIGFNSTVEYEYGGERHTCEIAEHYLKVYSHQNASALSSDHPLAHPKFEVKAKGGYPAPAFEAVQEHLAEILNAHVEWAGITRDDLVADDYYDPAERDDITTRVPTNYKLQLKEYFQSDGLAKTVIGMLFNRQTMAIHDILYCVIRKAWDNQISYDRLKKLTGLAKSTIGRYVSELVEKRIVSRKQSGGMFVRITDFAKEHIGGMLDQMRTESEIQEEIKQRKKERQLSREKQLSERQALQRDSPESPAAVASHHGQADGGTSMWTPLTESPVTMRDLQTLRENGDLSEADIAVRIKG